MVNFIGRNEKSKKGTKIGGKGGEPDTIRGDK